jgi:hypothetical protein
VRGDLLRELLLIVSYHFVRKAKSQPIRDAYPTNAMAVGPELTVSQKKVIHLMPIKF